MGMRSKFDCVIRKSFRSSKLKSMTKLAISRLEVLKNNRRARCSIARADVGQILVLGSHERALLRVEHVIKEQNMVDVFVMLESYCHLILERINLFEEENDCPDDLKEAVSSLIHASSRCGDFPELQEIRKIFASRFGKEFVARAVELRNNCGVNPKMIQLFSTKMPRLENKMKVLSDIASNNNIVLQLGSIHPDEEENQESHTYGEADLTQNSMKYKDVADAAQAAFESAAYAAEAARAAVELSRSSVSTPSIVYDSVTTESANVDPNNEEESGSPKTSSSSSSSSDEDVEFKHALKPCPARFIEVK